MIARLLYDNGHTVHQIKSFVEVMFSQMESNFNGKHNAPIEEISMETVAKMIEMGRNFEIRAKK
jgi:hypothetical protein